MKKPQNTIATGATIEGLVKLLNQYWYSSSVRIEGEQVFNVKGLVTGVRVINWRGGFLAYHI